MNIKTATTLLREKRDEINLPPDGGEVIVGLSGGVDSAVVALLLKKMRYKVRCVFLVCWDRNYPGCTSAEDQNSAIRTASQLSLPIEMVDFQNEYQDYVMKYFWSEYSLNRVPNADIVCNKHIKFGALSSYIASKYGDAWFATGHYAAITNGNAIKETIKSLSNKNENYQNRQLITSRKGLTVDENAVTHQPNEQSDNKVETEINHAMLDQNFTKYINVPKDRKKDQSYFLCQLPNEILSTVTFPLGVFTKDEVRQIAREGRLANSENKDSQGICFIGDVDMQKFIKAHIKLTSGDIIDCNGKVIGVHNGLALYTIGQRHNLNVKTYNASPLYVVDKDIVNNTLVVGNDSQRYIDQFSVSLYSPDQLALILLLSTSNKLQIRIRNLGELTFCSVYTPDQVELEKKLSHQDSMKNDNNSKVFIKLRKKETNVNPGQHAVFYFDNTVISSGTIDQVNTSYKHRFELTQ